MTVKKTESIEFREWEWETKMGISRALKATMMTGTENENHLFPRQELKQTYMEKIGLTSHVQINTNFLNFARHLLTRSQIQNYILDWFLAVVVFFQFSLSLTESLRLCYIIHFFRCSMIVIIITMCVRVCVKWWGKLSGLYFHWLNQNRTDSIRFESKEEQRENEVFNTISRYRWWRSQKLLMMTTNDGDDDDDIKSLFNPISLFSLVSWPDQKDLALLQHSCSSADVNETKGNTTQINIRKTLILMLWLLLLLLLLLVFFDSFLSSILLFNIRFQVTPNNGNEFNIFACSHSFEYI